MSADLPFRELATLTSLTESLDPVEPPAALRARLLEGIAHEQAVARAFGLALEDVRQAFAQLCDPDAWRPGPWPGSQLLTTPALMARRTVIAKLPGGTRISKHAHYARERTYVLDGLLIEDGRVEHRRGALLAMSPGSEHEIETAAQEACLVVFANLPVD